jgi:hypothetical protein
MSKVNKGNGNGTFGKETYGVTFKELLAVKQELEEQIAITMANVRDELKPIQDRLAIINNLVEDIANDELANHKTEDTGTFRFLVDTVTVKATISKKVEWDQAKLAVIETRIRNAGDDPAIYIQVKRSVLETAYKKWPEAIQKTFAKARTVTPSKPTFDYEV